MCFLKSLKIKKINKKEVLLENEIKAYYDKKIGKIKKDDYVLVYGNLILEKMEAQNNLKN